MTSPPLRSSPAWEHERLAALDGYAILDTPREAAFDDLAALAGEICDTPIALVSLIAADRQWFKAEIGLGIRETPLENAFCRHAILEQDLLVVPDATQDPRFDCNPLATGAPSLRFYAGALLTTADSLPLGTLCVLDTKPRTLEARQIQALRRLAAQVMAQLELRRALRAQAADHAQLSAILEGATDDAIIATDRAGRVTHWNRGAATLLGWDEAAARGLDSAAYFTPEDRDAGVPPQVMAAADATGRAVAERWQSRRDGTRFFAHGVTTPLRAGGLDGYLTILRDCTTQREAEQNLRLITETLPALIAYFDQDARLRFVNRAYAEWFGLPREAMLGRTFAELAGPDLQAARKEFIDRAMAGEATQFDSVVVDRQGSERTFALQYIPRRGTTGTVEGYYAIGVDVTERARLDTALQRLNITLEAQVAARTRERDGIWTLSPDLLMAGTLEGQFLAVNPAWTRVLGYSEEALLARPIWDIMDPEFLHRSVEAVERMRHGETTRHVNRVRAIDGRWRWFEWVSAPVGDLFYAVARDVTDEKERQAQLEQAQEALRQAQKMEVVGQLTGGVAHDFNNLLTVIRSSAELLRRPELPEERRHRYIDAIAGTVDRAARLTGQLLAFARRQTLKPEVFDVGERVRGIDDMLRTVVGSRVRLLTRFDPVHGRVEADRGQFETALVNMVVNARDAMDGEGTLTIEMARQAAIPPIRGHGGSAGSFVAISVTDTGAGISPERLPHIFEPFFTTKEVGKGTGLGLSQVYGFAKQSGGDVAVTSEVGRGSTFTLYLPRIEQDVAGAAPVPAALRTAIPGDGRRILVVEDNVDVGAFSVRLLEDLGYRTDWAANAKDALALLEAAYEQFDAVFSDVVMPGMSGMELGEEIRRRWPGLPVVLTSGYSHTLAEEGLHGFELLRKPYAIEELSQVLGGAAQRRGGAAHAG